MSDNKTGACQCGQVNYVLNADPLMVYACHCHDCQKRTGSACSMGMIVAADTIAINGELISWTRVSDKGEENTRYSCASCTNVIYGAGSNSPELYKVQAGTLNDTSNIRPEVHIWAQSMQPWIALDEHVTQYQTQPENMFDLLTDAMQYREKLAR